MFSRWCSRHESVLQEGTSAVIAGELRNVPKKWPKPLALVAKNSWWLLELALVDIDAFDAAYAGELAASSGALDVPAMVRLFVAAFLKIPAVVGVVTGAVS